MRISNRQYVLIIKLPKNGDRRLHSLSPHAFQHCRKTATRQSSTTSIRFISSSSLSSADIPYGIRLCTALFCMLLYGITMCFRIFFRNMPVFLIVYVYVQCTGLFYSIPQHCASVQYNIMIFFPYTRSAKAR